MRPEGRNYLLHFQYLRLGDLLGRLAVDSSKVLIDILLIPAFVVSLSASCQPDVQVRFEGGSPSGGASETSPTDSAAGVNKIMTYMELRVVGNAGVGRENLGEIVSVLDVFVYGAGGSRELESHVRLGADAMNEICGGGCLPVESGSESPRTVVVVANCPKAFNLKALAKMDSMELLEYEFREDDPSRPLMSGATTFTPGVDGLVEISPLLCEVVLNSVSNGLDGYELLESPSVRLCDVAPSARLLQLRDFRPQEVISSGELSSLPYDVGFYTQKPSISLWCYPNDTPETTLGAPHTSMEFNCRILGEDCVFPISLPPLGRASRTSVDLIINGPADFNCKIYQN